jgi:hypothetical protein
LTSTANIDDSRLVTDDGDDHNAAIVPFASSARPYEAQALH